MNQYNNLTKEELIRILERREQDIQYGLTWERDEIEKDNALNDDFIVLKPVPEMSFGENNYSNMIIEGDNYDALRYLRMTHAGKIKCIYIDPPYNTGNKDFIYNDHFFDKNHRFRHSVWLEFMYNRLKLAKELLHPEGVIFVSIDDNELFQLGLLMNRIFGENNFIANVIWQKVYSPKNSAKHFSVDHDYIMVYALNSQKWRPNPLPRSQAQNKAFKNPDDDPRGLWKASDLSARNYYSLGTYSVKCPSGRTIDGPPPGNYWRVSKTKLEELDNDNRIWWGKTGNNVPAQKRFLSEVKSGRVPQTLWNYTEVGHTQESKKEVLDILQFESSSDVFSTPKPTRLIERILRIATNKDDIILDFFAGSGTTAHSVLKLNQEDGGNRRYVLVSSSEATEEEPTKNICRDICAERVKRVIEGYQNKKGNFIKGILGDFVYMKTQKIPKHRLSTRLKHEQVWYALQMIHGFPLSIQENKHFNWQEKKGHAIAYIPLLMKNAIEALRKRIDGYSRVLTVYSWAPDRLKKVLPEVVIEPIPETLVKRFG